MWFGVLCLIAFGSVDRKKLELQVECSGRQARVGSEGATLTQDLKHSRAPVNISARHENRCGVRLSNCSCGRISRLVCEILEQSKWARVARWVW